MSSPLDEVCAIISDFEKEIVQLREIWLQVEKDNPYFEETSSAHWPDKYYRIWLHGAITVEERNELERWLYGDLLNTATANSSAQEVHDAWRDWLDTAGIPKWKIDYAYDKKTGRYYEVPSQEKGETYYADNDRFAILKPQESETLLTFILRLAREVEGTGKGHGLQWRALKSFLDFIRNHYPTEQVAFVEHIFPKKMDLYYDKIIRLIPPEAYPIPEKTAAEILIAFARKCCNGRPDARHTAIEGMTLCWLCIATSRIRLPKTLEMVFNIKARAILSGAEFSISKVPTYGSSCTTSDEDFSVLQVPTWFGEQPLKISNRIASFLKTASRIPSKQPRETILQRPKRSLTRMFDEVLQSVAPNSEYGNITYLSLLNQPHIFGNHRPQPKYHSHK
jgi:hypothetical protein